mmetsp:Transcript_30281/g.100428  ORF Transcript_30281/g.100428 Transcript_30281/m.100428 type:complete len:218 (+) Transcript_30281:129-782(+)
MARATRARTPHHQLPPHQLLHCILAARSALRGSGQEPSSPEHERQLHCPRPRPTADVEGTGHAPRAAATATTRTAPPTKPPKKGAPPRRQRLVMARTAAKPPPRLPPPAKAGPRPTAPRQWRPPRWRPRPQRRRPRRRDARSRPQRTTPTNLWKHRSSKTSLVPAACWLWQAWTPWRRCWPSSAKERHQPERCRQLQLGQPLQCLPTAKRNVAVSQL